MMASYLLLSALFIIATWIPSEAANVTCYTIGAPTVNGSGNQITYTFPQAQDPLCLFGACESCFTTQYTSTCDYTYNGQTIKVTVSGSFGGGLASTSCANQTMPNITGLSSCVSSSNTTCCSTSDCNTGAGKFWGCDCDQIYYDVSWVFRVMFVMSIDLQVT